MSSSKFLLVCFFIALAIVTGIPQTYCRGCEPSSCGNIRNISYPFRLKGDPENCGDPNYELVCGSNHTIVFCLGGRKYYVQAINYDNFTIRVVDSVIVAHKKNNNSTCSSLPLYSSTMLECGFAADGEVDLYYSSDSRYGSRKEEDYYLNHTLVYSSYQYKKVDGNDLVDFPIQKDVTFISCPHSVNSSVYVDITGACVNGSVSRSGNVNDNDYSNLGRHYYYYLIVGGFNSSQVGDNCSIALMAKTSLTSLKHGSDHKLSSSEIHNALLYGIELSWSSFKCPNCTPGGPCYVGGDVYHSCPPYPFPSGPDGPRPSCDIVSEGLFYVTFHHKCGALDRQLRIIMRFLWRVFWPIAARGTIGYVAPELINRSIGKISYKADVYSFGMLLIEMVGLKKNLTNTEDNSSQYFPDWIYDKFTKGKEIEIGDATDDEKKIVKKITLVALWCTQTNPLDRPSMTKVVEMLEGEVELLQVPPKPFQLSQYASTQDQIWTENSSDSVALLCDSSDLTVLQALVSLLHLGVCAHHRQ